MTTGSNTASRLAAENWRLTAELAETRDILRALRNGEVDALVGAEYDSIYVIQLIALAVDKAETYVDALALLMGKLCDATRSDYCEAWAVTPNRRSLQRTPVWCGSGGDAVRTNESRPGPDADPPAVLLDVFRTRIPQVVAIDGVRGGYAEKLRATGLQSGLLLPLVVDDRTLAVLALWNQERREHDEVVIERSRRILGESGRFVQRKLEQESRQETLHALRGVVRDRSRRLVELSVELDSKSRQHDEVDQALHRQTAMLQAVLDGMTDGVIVTDPAGRVLQFNPAARELLGKAPSDTPLDRWPDYYGFYRAQNGTPLRASEMPLAKALTGDRTERMEIFVRNEVCREGRTLEISASPVRDARTTACYGSVALLHDVTEQRRGESLRRRNLVEQRDALVRQVHHNVKNSLAGIIELVQQHAREHPEISALVQNVEAQLAAIATVHGIEALGGSGVQFGNLIDSLKENVHSLFGATVNMRLGNDDVWRLRLQESESVPLALALNELMVNACKHGKGGSFEFSAAREGQDLVVTIANSARRNARPPRALDGTNGHGLGIALVRSLLPHDKARLHYQHSDARVEAILRLAPDVFQPPA